MTQQDGRLPPNATTAEKIGRHYERLVHTPAVPKFDPATAVDLDNPCNRAVGNDEDTPPIVSEMGADLDTHLAMGKQPADA